MTAYGWRGHWRWLAFAAALAFTPFVSEAASPYRVGAITEVWSANHPAVEGLKEGLRDLGILEGRDVVYDIQFTSGKPDAAVAAARTLVKAGVHLIFTIGEAPTLAARNATQRIPIVFTSVGDPVSVGVVRTLVSPGENLTGVSSRTVELAAKRLEFLKILAPEARRVWFVYYSGDVTDSAVAGQLYGAAPRLGVEVLGRSVSDAAQLAQAIGEIRAGDPVLAPSGNTLDVQVTIHEAAAASRSPVIFPSAIWVSHGAVASYGSNLRAEGTQAARQVAKILRGARPQDVPVEGAEQVHLALNLKSAAALGAPLSRKLIFRANTVFR